jgi:sugar phosphate permease
MAASSIFPVIIGLAIWFLVRDDPAEKGYRSYVNHEAIADDRPFTHAMRGLREVLLYRNTWLLAIVPGGVVGSILSFAGLWGVPFLTTHHGISISDAAAICSAMLIVWAIGGLIFGMLSDRSGKQKLLYTVGCAVVALCWSVIAFVATMPVVMLIGVLMIASLFSGCMVLGFVFAKESVPPRLSGTVSGVVNMGVMMDPMILLPAVGWMLDRNWGGEMVDGVKYFDLSAYQSGFSLMALWAIVSFILILFTRESD